MNAYAYLVGWRIVRFLPEKFVYKTFQLIGDYVFKKNGKSIKKFRSNLQRVTGYSGVVLENLTREAMRSYMRYWCDTFRFPDWSKQRIEETVTVENEHLLMDAIAAKTGVIVSLPHAGNWDHAGAYYCSLGFKLTTVAERLKPEAVYKAFLNYRKDLGMEVLPLEPRVIAALSNRLQENGFVALVADRDLTDSGIEVTFFGKTAKMPAGPAALAIKTGALLLAAHVSYTDSGIAIEFEEIASNGSVQEVTQKMANFFEKTISKRPTDWHMLQRIWINDDL